MSSLFSASTVEQAALAWQDANGPRVVHSHDIAPGILLAEWCDDGGVLLPRRLCDTLLPKLVSGALRVRDAERIVGRCV